MYTTGGSLRRRLTALLSIAAIAALTTVAPASSASAKSARYSLYPTSAKTQTVEYGSSWAIGYHLSRKFTPCPYSDCRASFDVKIAGQSTEFLHRFKDYPGDYTLDFGSYSSAAAPLPVGTYVFSVVYHEAGGVYGNSSSSATLIVVPASLTTNVDIQTDPNHKSHAIISALATGKFIDVANLNGNIPDLPRYPRTPAGTWHFTVKDPSGHVVHTADVKSEAGAPAFATTYWTDPPPATVFSASAEFTPDLAVKSNFETTSADPISYTSSAAAPGQATPTAPPSANPTSTKSTGVIVPIWSVGAWGIVVLVLVVALLVLMFRRTERLARRTSVVPAAVEPKVDDNEA